jgi:hypothetical protein
MIRSLLLAVLAMAIVVGAALAQQTQNSAPAKTSPSDGSTAAVAQQTQTAPQQSAVAPQGSTTDQTQSSSTTQTSDPAAGSSRPAKMPATASPMPLVLATGTGLLLAALGISAIRRRVRS